MTPERLAEIRDDVRSEFDPHEFDLNEGLGYREWCAELVDEVERLLDLCRAAELIIKMKQDIKCSGDHYRETLEMIIHDWSWLTDDDIRELRERHPELFK